MGSHRRDRPLVREERAVARVEGARANRDARQLPHLTRASERCVLLSTQGHHVGAQESAQAVRMGEEPLERAVTAAKRGRARRSCSRGLEVGRFAHPYSHSSPGTLGRPRSHTAIGSVFGAAQAKAADLEGGEVLGQHERDGERRADRHDVHLSLVPIQHGRPRPKRVVANLADRRGAAV